MSRPELAGAGALDRRTLLARAAGAGAGLALGGRLLGGTASAAGRAGEVWRFASRPDLIPPRISVVQRAGETGSGLLFLGPSSGPGQRGAMIVDNAGEVVWFRPTVPETVINFRAALFHGEPVLTWWEGKTKHGLGIGEHVVFDRTYKELARFPAGDGRGADLHELILTPTGTALVTAYDIPTVDRSSVSSGRGRVIEGIVQELEVPSARVLFEWRSLDHVKLTESYSRVAPAFDYFHVNSVDLDTDGNLLVSARNTWTVYKVDRGNGKVLWRLGGKRGDFAMGPGTQFAWQHDARHHGDGSIVTVFDNADDPQVQPQSRGLTLALDEARMRATLVHSYTHKPEMLAHAFGSVQTQDNGNVLVGWGTEPYFTEYTAAGAIVLDAKLPRGGQNYRTLRFPWTATPTEPPRLVASSGKLYASWNGATEVASWQLLAGARADALAAHATVPRAGFETSFAAPAGAGFAAVAALDPAGRPLRRSATIAL